MYFVKLYIFFVHNKKSTLDFYIIKKVIIGNSPFYENKINIFFVAVIQGVPKTPFKDLRSILSHKAKKLQACQYLQNCL